MPNVLPSDAAQAATLGLEHHFLIEFDGQVHGWFTQCSGLTASIEFDEWEEGGLNGYTHKVPARMKYENLTLKQAMFASPELYEWFLKASRGQPARKPVTIVLRGPDGEPVRRWHFDRAFPVKWEGPSLDIDSNDAAVETIELAHEGLIFE